MTTTAQLARALESIAPERLAAPWDNVGLLVGDPEEALADGPVLCTVDLTARVAQEAIERHASAIVAYHPPIFKAIKSLKPSTQRERGLLRVIRAGMPILSPHTALDAAPGGLASWLVRTALASDDNGHDERALEAHEERDDEVKLVVFTPTTHADPIRAALAQAGAGVIGAYTHCSFQHSGSGTFLGDETTNPVVGERGTLQRVGELRLEMVCPTRTLARAIGALRGAHPYEEPAFDIVPLTPKRDEGVGAGRALSLGAPEPIDVIVERVRGALGVEMLKVATPRDERPITRIGACPGAGASLVSNALSDGCDAFLTGEMSHHEALAAIDAGCTLILAGHTHTERPYLPILARRLREAMSGREVVVAEHDRAPFVSR